MVSQKYKCRFSISFLLVATAISAIAVQQVHWKIISNTPIRWAPFSEKMKQQALASGRPVAVWLRPTFSNSSEVIEKYIDTPQTRLAFRKKNVLSLTLEYNDFTNDPVASNLIKEIGGHPFHSALGIYCSSGRVTNSTNGDFDSMSEAIVTILKDLE